MDQFLKLRSLPPSILLIIFSHSALHVSAASDYSIASFDSTADLSLSPACDTVYNEAIPYCQPYDFNSINPCSANCISSLQSIQTQAQAACVNQGIPLNSMLAYFQSGTGVSQLCSVMKSVATTLATQVSSTAAGSTATVPAGAGGVSYATEVPGDASEAEGTALSKGALLAVALGVVVGSVVLLFISIMLYRKYYRR
jgi:hypothetical protein